MVAASMCAMNCDKPCNQNCIVNTIAIIVFDSGDTNQLSSWFYRSVVGYVVIILKVQ